MKFNRLDKWLSNWHTFFLCQYWLSSTKEVLHIKSLLIIIITISGKYVLINLFTLFVSMYVVTYWNNQEFLLLTTLIFLLHFITNIWDIYSNQCQSLNSCDTKATTTAIPLYLVLNQAFDTIATQKLSSQIFNSRRSHSRHFINWQSLQYSVRFTDENTNKTLWVIKVDRY